MSRQTQHQNQQLLLAHLNNLAIDIKDQIKHSNISQAISIHSNFPPSSYLSFKNYHQTKTSTIRAMTNEFIHRDIDMTWHGHMIKNGDVFGIFN